ncbi:hypothetical protein EDB80DRAFT_686042 [Ilyonectria destructans]|nr:hypothetical protein EDB80DRAFT_686042 [Ilyonectria destructans]
MERTPDPTGSVSAQCNARQSHFASASAVGATGRSPQLRISAELEVESCFGYSGMESATCHFRQHAPKKKKRTAFIWNCCACMYGGMKVSISNAHDDPSHPNPPSRPSWLASVPAPRNQQLWNQGSYTLPPISSMNFWPLSSSLFSTFSQIVQCGLLYPDIPSIPDTQGYESPCSRAQFVAPTSPTFEPSPDAGYQTKDGLDKTALVTMELLDFSIY